MGARHDLSLLQPLEADDRGVEQHRLDPVDAFQLAHDIKVATFAR